MAAFLVVLEGRGVNIEQVTHVGPVTELPGESLKHGPEIKSYVAFTSGKFLYCHADVLDLIDALNGAGVRGA